MASRFLAVREALLHVGYGASTHIAVGVKAGEYSRRLIREYGPANVLLVRPVIAPGLWRSRSDADTAAFRAIQSAVTDGLRVDGRVYRWVHGKYGDTQCWFVADDTASADTVRLWHLPATPANARIPLFKLCARLDLMLSKTVPVATVYAEDGALGAVQAEQCYPLEAAFGGLGLCMSSPLGTELQGLPAPRVAVGSLPLVTLQVLQDAYSHTGQLMTDGCAPAGLGVLQAAYQGLLRSRRSASAGFVGHEEVTPIYTPSNNERQAGQQESWTATLAVPAEQIMDRIPAVFQGRLAGYKGCWYADPRLPRDTICVRPSQQKVEVPTTGSTETQRHVEVIRMSANKGPASLNLQIAALLAGWGVPADILLSLHSLYARSVLDMCTREDSARHVLGLPPVGQAVAEDDLRGYAEAGTVDAWQETSARRMLTAGLWGEHRLSSLLAKLRTRRMRAIVRKQSSVALAAALAFPVAKSRTAYVIADPTGLLQPGECFFRCSSSLAVDKGGRGGIGPDGVLRGNVLLARNPCHRPEHLQVATGVSLLHAYDRQRRSASSVQGSSPPSSTGLLSAPSSLSFEMVQSMQISLCDVLVLPVTGASPTVSLLSGGDYDGDAVWTCWEQTLVEPVVHAKKQWAQLQAVTVRNCESEVLGSALSVPAFVTAQSMYSSASVWPPQGDAFARVYLGSIRPDSLSAQTQEFSGKTPGSGLGLATNLHLAWLDKFLEDESMAVVHVQAAANNEGWGFSDGELYGTGAGAALAGEQLAGRPPLYALWQPQVLALADICAALVDAPKSGKHVSIPPAFKSVAYPHFMKKSNNSSTGIGQEKAQAKAGGISVRHSRSPLGQLADAITGISAKVRMELLSSPKHDKGTFGSIHASTMLQGLPSAHRALLDPWVSSGTPWIPHPSLVHAAEASGWLQSAPLAERHFAAFRKDAVELSQPLPKGAPTSAPGAGNVVLDRYRDIGGERDSDSEWGSSGSDSGSDSQSDGRWGTTGWDSGSDESEGEERGGDRDAPCSVASGPTHAVHPAVQAEARRVEMRVRGRARLMYLGRDEEQADLQHVPRKGTAQQSLASLPSPRPPHAVLSLALAYYMVAWHRYRMAYERAVEMEGAGTGKSSGKEKGYGSRLPADIEPYAFPWTVADVELMDAAVAKSVTGVH